MAKPERLSGYGLEIGACGIDRQSPRQNGSKESFFNSVGCSYPSANLDSNAQRVQENNQAFSTALQNTIAATDGDWTCLMTSLQDDPIMTNERGRRSSGRQKVKRSRSLQPRDSQSFRNPVMNLPIATEPSPQPESFVLPQYISNQYEESTLMNAGGSRQQKHQVYDHNDSKRWCHHVECLPHGVVWTTVGILLSWAGLGLALLCRQSLHFVRLENPWHIAAMYEDISALGVIHAGICYNETMSALQDASKVGCFKVALATNDDLNDSVFKLTAVFVTLSVLMGFILTVAMSTTLIWRTINFRTIGTGYLFVYCFQSLAFLYFDTDLCEKHECRVDIGCIYCIAASVCWISACLLCAKMESNRIRSDLAKERKRRKTQAAKEATRRQSTVHRSGAGTVVTDRTVSTISDELTLGFEKDEELGLASRETQPGQRHVRHRSLSNSQRKDLFDKTRTPRKQNIQRPVPQSGSMSKISTETHKADNLGDRKPPRRQSASEISPNARRIDRFADQQAPNGRTDSTEDRNTPRRQSSADLFVENGKPFRGYSAASDVACGIARQHESIITLGPSGRCPTSPPRSVLTSKSLEDTLDNRNRGRVEYQGRVLGTSRGRSRSKSKSRNRSKSRSRQESRQGVEYQGQVLGTSRGRSRSKSKSRNRSKSRSRQESRKTHQSKERSRSKDINARSRSKGRPQRIEPGKSPRAKIIDFDQELELATKKAQRKRIARTQITPGDFSAYKDVNVSPFPNHSVSQPTDIKYVTSYFDI